MDSSCSNIFDFPVTDDDISATLPIVDNIDDISPTPLIVVNIDDSTCEL